MEFLRLAVNNYFELFWLVIWISPQIYNLCRRGCAGPNYNKPIIFQPDIFIRWIRGKHRTENTPEPVHDAGIKLLHYRYLGYDYTLRKNAKNYARCGLLSGDKAAAWTCAPDYVGEGSPAWTADLFRLAFPVI